MINSIKLEKFCDTLNLAMAKAEDAGTISKSGVYCYVSEMIDNAIIVDCSNAYDV